MKMSDKKTNKPILEAGHNLVKLCRHGPMIYNRHDQWVGRSLDIYGEYNEAEADFLHQIINSGHNVVEIGANIGSHTVGLAKKAGPKGTVIAFEAQAVVFQTLCANVALNGLLNVKTFHMAVGNENGTITVPQPDYAKPGNFGGVSLGMADRGEQVQIVRIDDLLTLESCRLMKIDVEGMEADVVRGAENTIQSLKPILYIENDRQDKSPELIDLIMSLGYSLYWHLPPLFNRDNFFAIEKNLFQNDKGAPYLSINMLCVPAGIEVANMERLKIHSPEDWWRNLMNK